MKQVEYTITDPNGIHARPAGQLVKEAAKYTSSITIKKGEKSADAKKIFGLMGLGVKCNETISITIEGEDEENAFAAIDAFMNETW